MPAIMAQLVMRIGRRRLRPPSIAAATGSALFCRACSAKVTSKIALATATPTAMMAPIADWMFRVVPVSHSNPTTPATTGISDEFVDNSVMISPFRPTILPEAKSTRTFQLSKLNRLGSTETTKELQRLYSTFATQSIAASMLFNCRYGFTSLSSRSYFAFRTFSA